MSDAKGNQEPSMEEILASIRRIISEDGEPKEEPAAPAVNGHAAEEPEADDDDALVLTDMVVGDSNVVELQEEPELAPAPPPAPPAAAAPPPAEPEPEPELEALPEPEVAAADDVAPDIELDVAQPPAADTSDAMMEDGLPAEPIAVEPRSASGAGIADNTPEGELVSPDVAAASAATMAQLVAKKPQLSSSRHASIDGLLVETLVRQAIEPMLKEWLDEHLQEIVERLVRREVERLSRKAELS
jgi:cell pole-organizing protein PopZ